MNIPSTPFSFQRRGSAGFSLAESIISIGIASSVLLAVVALLAGSLGGARDTKTETVAGMVARRLMAEARHDVNVSGMVAAGEVTNLLLLDDAMQPVATSRTGALSEGDYERGSADPRAVYVARSARVPSVRQPGMLDLEIRVETPASAPRGQRKVFRYASLLSRP